MSEFSLPKLLKTGGNLHECNLFHSFPGFFVYIISRQIRSVYKVPFRMAIDQSGWRKGKNFDYCNILVPMDPNNPFHDGFTPQIMGEITPQNEGNRGFPWYDFCSLDPYWIVIHHTRADQSTSMLHPIYGFIECVFLCLYSSSRSKRLVLIERWFCYFLPQIKYWNTICTCKLLW